MRVEKIKADGNDAASSHAGSCVVVPSMCALISGFPQQPANIGIPVLRDLVCSGTGRGINARGTPSVDIFSVRRGVGARGRDVSCSRHGFRVQGFLPVTHVLDKRWAISLEDLIWYNDTRSSTRFKETER